MACLDHEGSQPNIRVWDFGPHHYTLGEFPKLMGIVNVTPDSFSDAGSFFDPEVAIDHALKLVADGADILDIGGESTRPGSRPVDPEEELRRVRPVVAGIAKQSSVLISIDTTKASVARQAIDAGARVVNDISGLTFDAEMPAVCRDARAGVICMHMQGTPQTMQTNPTYDGDVVDVIAAYFEQRLRALVAEGVPEASVVLDPGIGFGKTAAHNLRILASVGRFRNVSLGELRQGAGGRPVLIGHSRKRFLAKILGRPVDERTFGTVGISVALAQQGADIIRVHDVAATRDALLAWKAVADELARSPSVT